MEITQQSEPEKLSISNLQNGAAIEMIDEALGEVFSNIWDPNTEAKQKRAMHFTITFSPDEERDIVTMGMSIKNNLAKCKQLVARVNLSRIRGGEIIASELRSRQMSLPTIEESVDPETGEVIPFKKGM